MKPISTPLPPLEEDDEKIDINISDEDFLVIAKRAHARNITINHMFERLIVSYLLANKKAPKGPTKKPRKKK